MNTIYPLLLLLSMRLLQHCVINESTVPSVRASVRPSGRTFIKFPAFTIVSSLYVKFVLLTNCKTKKATVFILAIRTLQANIQLDPWPSPRQGQHRIPGAIFIQRGIIFIPTAAVCDFKTEFDWIALPLRKFLHVDPIRTFMLKV